MAPEIVAGLYKPCHPIYIRTVVHQGIHHTYCRADSPVNPISASTQLVTAIERPTFLGITRKENIFYLK